jgi:hypothetical protein
VNAADKKISAVLKILFDIGFTEIDDYLNENSIPGRLVDRNERLGPGIRKFKAILVKTAPATRSPAVHKKEKMGRPFASLVSQSGLRQHHVGSSCRLLFRHSHAKRLEDYAA